MAKAAAADGRRGAENSSKKKVDLPSKNLNLIHASGASV
jgi:hypothetical protein